MAARQARARGVQHVLAPVVDVARDPRWGRIEETYGEDPYLVGADGRGRDPRLPGARGPLTRRSTPQHVLATAKHFTGHGTPEGGRNTAPGNYSTHVLREVFLPPFEAAVREADVASRDGRATTRSTASPRTPTAGCSPTCCAASGGSPAWSSPTTSASPSSSASTTWCADLRAGGRAGR